MYAWLWRHLPGPWPARLLTALVLMAAVVLLLFTSVFPWVTDRLDLDEVTIAGWIAGAPGS